MYKCNMHSCVHLYFNVAFDRSYTVETHVSKKV